MMKKREEEEGTNRSELRGFGGGSHESW